MRKREEIEVFNFIAGQCLMFSVRKKGSGANQREWIGGTEGKKLQRKAVGQEKKL